MNEGDVGKRLRKHFAEIRKSWRLLGRRKINDSKQEAGIALRKIIVVN